jgi:hypothetical protein
MEYNHTADVRIKSNSSGQLGVQVNARALFLAHPAINVFFMSLLTHPDNCVDHWIQPKSSPTTNDYDLVF